jgi:hypothetical protein
MVGTTIATKLVSLGHEVVMGSRSASNDKSAAWLAGLSANADKASAGTFADAATFGELLFNCTSGGASLAALNLAGTDNIAGKILIDIANPLDFSQGMPPRLSISNDSSLGEQIQAAFPKTKVVKTLNTLSCELMVEPSKLAGAHTIFMSGDDAEAKATVERTILREAFGWADVIDLGDISTARGTEMFLPLWVRTWAALGTADFNIHVVRAK